MHAMKTIRSPIFWGIALIFLVLLLLVPPYLRKESDFSEVLQILELENNHDAKLTMLREVNLNDRLHKTGLTPLHHVVMKNDADGVKILLEAGADATLRDDTGHTPLEFASSLPSNSIAKLIQQHLADESKAKEL